MPPTEGNMMHHGVMANNTISLATLIDWIVQRTFHELTVLSEILPRKTDMERKIEIVQFASRTRQLFIRLLALVKWANSASKVDKCAEICNFLEQQSMWFVDTADTMVRMARETLVNARLPNFSVPCAIDVLTLGTYPRLPTCIREKIVPPDPITISEKKQTLQRLNQVIQYRLVSTELPQQMRKLKIENGRVKFLVENEFQVTLTLMEDSPVIPWRLLDIEILVEDHETGDGKSLVHTLQIGYIHRLAQSRLLDNDKPLHDLYRVLHSFCQSLQLEVLHSQTQKLIRERLGDKLRIEEYSVGKCLSVSYWRDQIKRDKADSMIYKLTIHINEEDDSKQLCVSHQPSMLPDECRRVGLTIKSEHLSIENLLMQTIEVRTRAKLKDLSYVVQRYLEGKCEIRDMPLALHMPVVYPCMTSEQLRITVDSQKGALLASLPTMELPVLHDLEETLNCDRKNVQKHIVNLRLQLTMLRCEKSVQCLHSTAKRQLPLISQPDHAIEKLPKHKLYIPVPKQPTHYVVVSLEDKPPRSVELQYHLLEVIPCVAEGMEAEEDINIKPYMKAGRLVALDTFAFTNGPYTGVQKNNEETEIESFHRKRKLLLGQYTEPVNKKGKMSPYIIPELVHIVAACEERLPFVYLGEALKEQGVLHTNIQTDKQAMGYVMDIIYFPDPAGVSRDDCSAFRRTLLSCKVRIITKPSRNWQVEFLFTSGLLKTSSPRETGPTQRVICDHELSADGYQKVVKDLIDEWTAMCHLYSIVKQFAELYNDSHVGIQHLVEIRSYNYKKITLLYGQNNVSFAHVIWKCDVKQFLLFLGTEGQSTTINPHVCMTTQLQHDLNRTRSLSYLVQILHDTWAPMNSLHKLSSAVVLGVGTSPKQSNQSFTIIPQSSTHVRIAYRNNYCLDVHFRSNKLVAVRDGAYSLFDTSKATEGCTPIPMLKAFLGMFADDTTGSNVRRRSTTEDDNPPSPVGMDNMEVFNISQSLQSSGSPGSRPRGTDIAPSPSTFIGTPSPGNILAAGSPGNPQLHVPSPGSFVPAPSPSSLGIHMQSPASSFISPQAVSESGSPYPTTSLAMPSPGQRNWPNSPSVQGPSPASRAGMAASPGHPSLHSPQTISKDDHSKATVMSPPSRILPQRSWAASTPTLLSHEAFDNLLKQTPIQQLPYHVPLSPLERFLGCKFIRRHIARVIGLEKHLSMQATEPGVNVFKADTLTVKISLNTSTLQTLHMKIQPAPEFKDQWSAEEIQIFERYFDLKVGGPPYKCHSLTAFGRLLKAPIRILKDCVQIMRLELMPNQDRNLKWSVQLLFTVPPTYAHIAPAGTPAIVVMAKMVLMLQLTRIGLQLPQQSEAQSIMIPILYNIQDNSIQLVEKGPISNPNLQQVGQMLKRFMERYHQSPECAIYPAVRELMTNLVLPVG